MITAEFVRSILVYDPETGVFTRRVARSNRPAGEVAGTLHNSGNCGYTCILISIKKRLFRAHRLAWLYVHGTWPPMDIDHINGDATDNRLANLRLATKSQNLSNMKKPATNTSGRKGVSRRCDGKKWQVHIRADGKSRYVGCYDDLDEAHAAYVAAARRYKGEFARAA